MKDFVFGGDYFHENKEVMAFLASLNSPEAASRLSDYEAGIVISAKNSGHDECLLHLHRQKIRARLNSQPGDYSAVESAKMRLQADGEAVYMTPTMTPVEELPAFIKTDPAAASDAAVEMWCEKQVEAFEKEYAAKVAAKASAAAAEVLEKPEEHEKAAALGPGDEAETAAEFSSEQNAQPQQEQGDLAHSIPERDFAAPAQQAQDVAVVATTDETCLPAEDTTTMKTDTAIDSTTSGAASGSAEAANDAATVEDVAEDYIKLNVDREQQSSEEKQIRAAADESEKVDDAGYPSLPVPRTTCWGEPFAGRPDLRAAKENEIEKKRKAMEEVRKAEAEMKRLDDLMSSHLSVGERGFFTKQFSFTEQEWKTVWAGFGGCRQSCDSVFGGVLFEEEEARRLLHFLKGGFRWADRPGATKKTDLTEEQDAKMTPKVEDETAKEQSCADEGAGGAAAASSTSQQEDKSNGNPEQGEVGPGDETEPTKKEPQLPPAVAASEEQSDDGVVDEEDDDSILGAPPTQEHETVEAPAAARQQEDPTRTSSEEALATPTPTDEIGRNEDPNADYRELSLTFRLEHRKGRRDGLARAVARANNCWWKLSKEDKNALYRRKQAVLDELRRMFVDPVRHLHDDFSLEPDWRDMTRFRLVKGRWKYPEDLLAQKTTTGQEQLANKGSETLDIGEEVDAATTGGGADGNFSGHWNEKNYQQLAQQNDSSCGYNSYNYDSWKSKNYDSCWGGASDTATAAAASGVVCLKNGRDCSTTSAAPMKIASASSSVATMWPRERQHLLFKMHVPGRGGASTSSGAVGSYKALRRIEDCLKSSGRGRHLQFPQSWGFFTRFGRAVGSVQFASVERVTMHELLIATAHPRWPPGVRVEPCGYLSNRLYSPRDAFANLVLKSVKIKHSVLLRGLVRGAEDDCYPQDVAAAQQDAGERGTTSTQDEAEARLSKLKSTGFTKFFDPASTASGAAFSAGVGGVRHYEVGAACLKRDFVAAFCLMLGLVGSNETELRLARAIAADEKAAAAAAEKVEEEKEATARRIEASTSSGLGEEATQDGERTEGTFDETEKVQSTEKPAKAEGASPDEVEQDEETKPPSASVVPAPPPAAEPARAIDWGGDRMKALWLARQKQVQAPKNPDNYDLQRKPFLDLAAELQKALEPFLPFRTSSDLAYFLEKVRKQQWEAALEIYQKIYCPNAVKDEYKEVYQMLVALKKGEYSSLEEIFDRVKLSEKPQSRLRWKNGIVEVQNIRWDQVVSA
eukprot:g1546.t1